MRVSSAKTAPRVERNIYLTSKRIKAYGQSNDYPQKILEIINASGTGRSCMDTYVSFVEGNGFTDKIFNSLIINDKGERNASLLRKAAKDLKNFNGFAILIKYNALGIPAEYYNVPFEYCRIEIDSAKEYTGRIAIYWDWTGISGQRFDIDKVKYVNRYDPLNAQKEIEEAGGWYNYIGQLLYYTADGDFDYPISPFDPIVTDMLTEESVSTVKHRNAKYNFLPAGILVRKGVKPKTLDNGTVDESDPVYQAQVQSADMIRKMQGDENTSKIWVVDVDADEEKPEFIDFTAKNFDEAYKNTETTVQENIGRMFKIPPILRGIDVGAGFGADLMKNAYDFMNSLTGSERNMISVAFRDIFMYYPQQFNDFTIEPLQYVV